MNFLPGAVHIQSVYPQGCVYIHNESIKRFRAYKQTGTTEMAAAKKSTAEKKPAAKADKTAKSATPAKKAGKK